MITSPETALGFFGPFQTSECMMPENAPVDTEVAELFTQDPDNPADTHTYTMTDNGGGRVVNICASLSRLDPDFSDWSFPVYHSPDTTACSSSELVMTGTRF